MNKESLVEVGETVLMNTYKRGDKLFIEGEGTYIKDGAGKKYLDFVSGIATNSLGHAPPGLAEAIGKQAKTLMHTSNLFWNQPSIELAEKLTEHSGLDKVFFTNSGSESNEAAIKLARKWGRESKNSEAVEIITMKDSFHGRTMGALTATGQPQMHKDFAPYLPGFKYVSLNDSKALEEAVDEKTCAILVETLQGEGGVNAIHPDYVQTINKLQKEKNILVMIDEVQTGMGRTGHWFSYQASALSPDIITSAKGLGGGFPIGAVIARDHIARHFGPGDHGTTFGGNPLATAAAKYVVDTIEEEKLLENVKERSHQLFSGLEKLKEKYDLIEEVRGKGLLVGVKLKIAVSELIEASYQKGLLVVSAKDNVFRILPPLNVSAEEIEEGLSLLDQAFKELPVNKETAQT